ncbi:MAG: pyridoxal-phosphate dependent enzyme [Bacteroidales bacterium]|jgi:threonine dehydratase|nr:pyridoxal-phosphate dependent enzyme [Bacteroidales bacterium]
MTEFNFNIPTKKDISEAEKRIRGSIVETPVITCDAANDRVEAELFFKCENLQKAGSFKSRGACNNILSLSPEDLKRGVCTHSSGNHAAALARAAFLSKTKAYIVMPDKADKTKVALARKYGAEIFSCDSTLAARETMLEQVKKETGAIEIHPYNNLQTITGQATACKELLKQCNNSLDIVIAPVGGGGLLSGTALSAHYFGENVRVIGAEPEMADDATRSFYAGQLIPSENPQTMADGLRTSLGSYTFPIILNYVYEIFTVSEESIAYAMRFVFDNMKIVIEPSSAVTLAAIFENFSVFAKKKVGVILSGGNIGYGRLYNIFEAFKNGYC